MGPSYPRAARGLAVAVDGSQPALAAVRWAAHSAALRNAPLTIVHIATTDISSGVEFVYSSAAQLQQHRDDEAHRIVAAASEMASEMAREMARAVEGREGRAGRAGRPIEIRTEIRLGPAVPTLVELSKRAQLLVVGSSGRGALSRVLLGSVSTGVVQHARCPVAVIPGDSEPAPQPDRRPVIVGIDGSATSELATAVAFEEAALRGAELIALHVCADVLAPPIPAEELARLHARADAMLAESLAGYGERYADVAVTRRIVDAQPARRLCEESSSAQLVVVGSHGRGGFTGMLLGSVSHSVVQCAHSPVIVARRV